MWGIHNDEIRAEDLVAGGFISIGWHRIDDLRSVEDDQAAIRELVRAAYPDAKEGAVPVWAGVLRRFAFEIAEGDVVIAPDREARLINIGLVAGPYRHETTGEHPHRRDVTWLVTGLPRTSFSQPALNEIGSALTLFEVRRHINEFAGALADADHPIETGRPPEEPMGPGLGSIRDLGDEYLRAIRSGDAVLTPGTGIWSLQNSRELERVFVNQPDAGGRSFEQKLADQLAGASDGAVQLFAELWCLSLAPLSDYTRGRKRMLLNWILARMAAPAELPAVVETALDTRAFKGGVAFKTRRPFQLALLVRVASALLSLAEDDRAAALAEPRAFEAVLESVPEPKEPAQRCALRWLLFPDYYLPIVSGKHRSAIRDAFADLLDGTAANLDEELHQIRTALAEEGDQDVNFYRLPLVDRWDPGRVLSGVPPTIEHLTARTEFKTPRYVLASSAVGTVEEGEWTTYTDVAAVAGLIPGQVGDYLGKVHHEAGHRVIKIDGTTYTAEVRADLEAEGIRFDERGSADPQRRISRDELRGRMETLGAVPQPVRRAWLVRGNNVEGRNLVPGWLADDRLSLAAASLRQVEPGLTRDQLKPIVDEDYSHASYAARAEKLDEFHAFLSRMQIGHLVVTVDQGRLHFGEISGEASYLATTDTDAQLVRNVDWQGEGLVEAVPGDLAARLKVQRDVLDLTQHLGLLEELLAADEEGTPPVGVTPLVLPDATVELARSLHIEREWLQECIELLRDRPQLIFFGPPGTGKTYIARALGEHFTSGWTSGINAYATVLILGLLGRFAGVEEIPAGLQRTDVLIAAGVLTVVEFVADKIPYVDSAWDAISTVVRPVAGAVIGVLLAGGNGDLVTLALASVGGVTALVSHLVKAGLRLAINTSPEPASNIGASLAGDVSVAGVSAFAVLNPVVAVVIVAVLLVVGVWLTIVVMGRVRRGWRAFRRWLQPT